MTEEEGLELRTQTYEMNSGDEAITDVPYDDNHELFKTTRSREGRVIKRPTHLDVYGV